MLVQEMVKSRDGELEWMRAERRDEQLAWQRDHSKATNALREAEAMSSRAKAARRDEGRKLNKEKAALQERLKAAEGAQRRAEDEVARCRASASGAAEQQQRAEQELESQSSQLRESLQKREAEVRAPCAPDTAQGKHGMAWWWEAPCQSPWPSCLMIMALGNLWELASQLVIGHLINVGG